MTIKEKIKEFQKDFNPIFIYEVKKLLKEQKDFYPTEIDEHIEKSVIDYCTTGKRIRPFLIYYFSQKNLDDINLKNLTLASELFHLAALLQDDVMDESLIRRNVPTLNAIGDELSVHNKNLGDHFGILLGDVFWTAAMKLSASLPQNIFEEFITMIQRTVRGQYLDVLGMNDEYGYSSKEAVLARHDLKTAWYTFTTPARLGYMLNENYHDKHLAVITPIVRELGLLFQIRDDIIDCIDENSGKPLFGDISEGQTTWVTLYIKENYPEKFAAILEAKKTNDIMALRNIFNDINLREPYQIEFDKCNNMIEELDPIYSDVKEKAKEVLGLLLLS